jgi:hypothetical protein
VVALVDRYARASDQVTGRVENLIRGLLGRFSGWYDDRQVAVMADAVARVVRSGQEARAQATRAYLERVLREVGVPVRPVRVTLPADVSTGVLPQVEWGRAAAEFRRRRVEGLVEADALAAAELRAITRADLTMQRAASLAARQVLDRTPGVVGYRRIIHPELSAGGTCGLCVAASDRIYKVSELLPIHASCKCTVAPVVVVKGLTQDPGQSLNKDSLRELYRLAGGTGTGDLARVRYAVSEHGELGPLLTRAGQAFRGPDDIAA